MSTPDGCTLPARRFVVFVDMDGGVPTTRLGDFCREPGEPLTPAGLVPGVRDQFEQDLPRLRPSFQPANRGIVNLPVLFATGEAASLDPPAFTLGSHQVVLRATAQWDWRFGDGAEQIFDVPGGVYPDVDVSHTYPAQGTFDVRVTSTWQGQFWVDGAGPFPVTGQPLTQTQPLVVPVKEAHAVLIG